MRVRDAHAQSEQYLIYAQYQKNPCKTPKNIPKRI